MKVLITGKNSYIGQNIKWFLEKYNYNVDELDTLDDTWKKYDYSIYDVIIHVAAIVHENSKNSSPELFKVVNTDLPYNVAMLSKKAGVKHFIFFSTMAVYGQDKKLPHGNIIDENTEFNPVTLYGKSKYEAEKKLLSIVDDNFNVSIIRPPNVYGKNCKGNYMRLFKKMCSLLPFFPNVYNNSKQSFIYIDNLSNIVRLIIENNAYGEFMPQDNIIPSTPKLIDCISDAIGKKMRFTKTLGFFVKIFRFIPIVKKVYGGVSYDYKLSDCFNYEYQIISFEEGIKRAFED